MPSVTARAAEAKHWNMEIAANFAEESTWKAHTRSHASRILHNTNHAIWHASPRCIFHVS